MSFDEFLHSARNWKTGKIKKRVGERETEREIWRERDISKKNVKIYVWHCSLLHGGNWMV